MCLLPRSKGHLLFWSHRQRCRLIVHQGKFAHDAARPANTSSDQVLLVLPHRRHRKADVGCPGECPELRYAVPQVGVVVVSAEPHDLPLNAIQPFSGPSAWCICAGRAAHLQSFPQEGNFALSLMRMQQNTSTTCSEAKLSIPCKSHEVIFVGSQSTGALTRYHTVRKQC